MSTFERRAVNRSQRFIFSPRFVTRVLLLNETFFWPTSFWGKCLTCVNAEEEQSVMFALPRGLKDE
jgi:hypothetical protein